MDLLIAADVFLQGKGNSAQLRQRQLWRHTGRSQPRRIESVFRKSFQQHAESRLLLQFDSFSGIESRRSHQKVVAIARLQSPGAVKRCSGATSTSLEISPGIGTAVILPS